MSHIDRKDAFSSRQAKPAPPSLDGAPNTVDTAFWATCRPFGYIVGDSDKAGAATPGRCLFDPSRPLFFWREEHFHLASPNRVRAAPSTSSRESARARPVMIYDSSVQALRCDQLRRCAGASDDEGRQRSSTRC